ncbi:MAG: MBL fold metallo-hydrolase [Planctomycetes bacterium]|nr:MBL fold metallo-hydrolase [Planctomycetota bacterium]
MSAKPKRGFRRLEQDQLARLTFLGAAGEVTGSAYLLETQHARVLFDCGMHQGDRRSRALNSRRFEFDPGELDAVVLTHAHIDHSGLLPKLVRDGFRGKIHLTIPSGALLGVLLRDSAHIHEQDTKHENRRRSRQGKRALAPLYETPDAERALDRLVLHPFDRVERLAEGLRVRFVRAGHILGAASIECWVNSETVERKVVFSGDLGRRREPLLLPPEAPRAADLVLLESTYGDRDHKDLDATVEELAHALRESTRNGGNVLIPVFAVGRAQEVLHYIAVLESAGRIPELPVYLDSPMAIRASALYQRNADCLQSNSGGARCTVREPRQLTLVPSPQESIALNEQRGIVILSASGMCEGGRIMHHLRHNLWRPSTDIVIVGFQARGTLGRALVDGASNVRIFGERITVAARVHTLGGFSAHAGQTELVEWVTPMIDSGACVALVHGEVDKRAALAARLSGRTRAPIWQPLRRDRVLLRERGEPVGFESAADESARKR